MVWKKSEENLRLEILVDIVAVLLVDFGFVAFFVDLLDKVAHELVFGRNVDKVENEAYSREVQEHLFESEAHQQNVGGKGNKDKVVLKTVCLDIYYPFKIFVGIVLMQFHIV